jgi:GntR family transcriptional repressor for pyruvate dehydrogenase complex
LRAKIKNAPSPPHKSAEPARMTARLVERFKRLISSGALTPGCRLPPERELAKTFGVNRTSLRQVLKVLEIMGVLSQRVGDGTYLNNSAEALLNEPLDFLILLDDLSHHELFETRMIVEPELAARAAERATSEDLAALRQSIEAMENSRTTATRLDADVEFHAGVCRAAGNRICTLMFAGINRILFDSMSLLAGRVELRRPLSFHKAVYQAIHGRDPAEARRQMAAHLLDARNLLTAAPKNRRVSADISQWIDVI